MAPHDDARAPTDDLIRSVVSPIVSNDTGDGLTLEGYGAIFNSETVIDSWEGNFVETIAPGAFRKTLRDRTPVMQFDHGRDTRVGSIPIGAFETITEDDVGLFTRARLHDNEQVKPVRDAIASGAIPGMSIRFAVVKERWADPAEVNALPTRTILEAKLYEVGPVVFPAYTGTSVGVRDEIKSLAQDPEFRKELIRALGLSTPDGAAEGTSTDDAEDTPAGAVDTSDDEAARSDKEHTEETEQREAATDTPAGAVAGTSDADSPESTHRTAVRQPLPLARLRQHAAEVREYATSAAASEKDY